MEDAQPQNCTQKMTARHVLVVITGILVCFGPATLVFNTWSILVVPVCEGLDLATGSFTFYISVVFICSAIAAPIAGNLMERFDLRVVITTAAVLASGGILLCSTYTDVWQFYLSGALEGVGVVVLTGLTAPTLINRWFDKHIGLLIGLCVAMMGVGAAIWNVLGGMILNEFGWRMCYVVFGVIAAVLSIPATLFFIRSYPEDVGTLPYGRSLQNPTESTANVKASSRTSIATTKKGSSNRRRGSVSAKRAFAMPAFFLLSVTIALNNGVAQMGNYLATYLHHLSDIGSLAITSAEVVIMASSVVACLQVAQACAKIALGQIADHSLRIALFLAYCCGLAGVMFCWQGSRIDPDFFYAGSALFGILYAGTNVLGPTITRYLFGPRDYTLIYSRVSIVVNLFPAFFIPLFALLSDTNWDLFFGFAAGVVVLILVCVCILMHMAKHIEPDE